jgi:hypothetical protein
MSRVGYQIIFGAGCGLGFELCNIAVQTVLPADKVEAGISLAIFARSLGGAIAVSVGQNVFEQKLRKNLRDSLPNLDPSVISGSGATNLISNVQKATGGNEAEVKMVLDLYNNAIVQVFLVGIVLSAITFPAALLIEWKSVKKEKMQKKTNGTEEEVSDEKTST